MPPHVALQHWLTSLHPSLPWVLLTALIWLGQYGLRKLFPNLWEAIANLPFPEGELGPWLTKVRQAWQALPSLLAGALVGAFFMGEDFEQAWKGALAGVAAPLWHHALKWLPVVPYRGATKLVALLVCLALAGAGATACQRDSIRAERPGDYVQTAAALAFNGAVVAFEVLDLYEADRIDGLLKPTDAQIAAATLRVQRLERVRDMLEIARDWLEGKAAEGDGRAALVDATHLLELAAAELQAEGVAVPHAVRDGIKAAKAFAGSG
jgi:hypothetical protein